MICYDIKNDYNRAFLTIWGRLLEQKAYSRDRTSHHIPRNPRQYLFALIFNNKVEYTEKLPNMLKIAQIGRISYSLFCRLMCFCYLCGKI